MSENPLEPLESLGKLEQYRQPGNIEKTAADLRRMLEELKAELAKRNTDRDKAVYLMDIFERMILSARHRACDCELDNSKVAPMACENVDLFHVMTEWLEIGRTAFKK